MKTLSNVLSIFTKNKVSGVPPQSTIADADELEDPRSTTSTDDDEEENDDWDDDDDDWDDDDDDDDDD